MAPWNRARIMYLAPPADNRPDAAPGEFAQGMEGRDTLSTVDAISIGGTVQRAGKQATTE